MSTTKYFEDFEIGVESESDHEYVVTTEELKQMAERWDPQPFHLDENAPETKECGGLITCSAHTSDILSGLQDGLKCRNPLGILESWVIRNLV